MRFHIILTLLTVLFLSACHSGEARTIRGRVARISDGDTITVLTAGNRQLKVRFYGIDAPELHQAFGKKAREALEKILAGREVSVAEVNIDDYGRTVGLVRADGINVNREMVKSGYAWVYDYFCKKSFCREWQRDEQAARRARRGLWQDREPIPPWEWRRAGHKRR